MAKLVLDMDEMTENFFSEAALIGIVCPLPSHRFCGNINRLLDMDFVRRQESDPRIISSKKEEHFFHFYEYCLPLNGGRYAMYRLKSDNEVLLPEVKQLDYLWMIECADYEEKAQEMIQLLRNLPDVQLAQIIDPDRLKNSYHLLV